jgi:putative restriction endonuclease
MSRIFLCPTDFRWFSFLRQRPQLEEINFWQPSGTVRFRALSPGELFLFKLKAPHNAIGGGGFLVEAPILPIHIAWEAFGEGNGRASLNDLRASIADYRKGFGISDFRTEIGCIILRDSFFLDESDWIAPPSDWSSNIVRGKGYDSSEPLGRDLLGQVQERLSRQLPTAIGEIPATLEDMFGEARLVRPRLGQGSFRVLVTEAYQRRCAVTGGKVLPVLQAAHILPVSEGGAHRLDNGILLRSDLHTLFDRGYVTIRPDFRFQASGLLKDEFDNGDYYRALTGKEIALPPDEDSRPGRDFLEWHNDVIFRG